MTTKVYGWWSVYQPRLPKCCCCDKPAAWSLYCGESRSYWCVEHRYSIAAPQLHNGGTENKQ